MVIGPLSSRTFKVEESSTTYLGILTSIPAQGHGMKSLSFTTTKDALLVYPDRVSRWTATKIIEHEQKFLILGPWLDLGEFLPWSSLPKEEKLRRVLTLARCFPQILEHSDYHGPLGGFWLFFLLDGGLLILPEAWARTILHNLSDHEQQEFRYLLEPPALGKKTPFDFDFGYMLGLLAYEVLTDDFPYTLTGISVSELMDLSQRKKAQLFQPLGIYSMIIPQVLTELVHRLLREPVKEDITLLGSLEKEFIQVLNTDNNTHPPEETKNRKKQKNRWELSLIWFRWKEKARKNRGLIFAGLIGMIFLFSLGNTILTRVLSPPTSLGWEPSTLVHEFYQAATNLDAELMDRLVVDGAAREFRQMVVQLFATARVRQAYEMRNPVLTPDAWEDQGRTGLEDSILVFGIRDLKILEIETLDDILQVQVKYDFYLPEFPEEGIDDQSPGLGVQINEVREALTLRKHRDAWFISSIVPQTLW